MISGELGGKNWWRGGHAGPLLSGGTSNQNEVGFKTDPSSLSAVVFFRQTRTLILEQPKYQLGTNVWALAVCLSGASSSSRKSSIFYSDDRLYYAFLCTNLELLISITQGNNMHMRTCRSSASCSRALTSSRAFRSASLRWRASSALTTAHRRFSRSACRYISREHAQRVTRPTPDENILLYLEEGGNFIQHLTGSCADVPGGAPRPPRVSRVGQAPRALGSFAQGSAGGSQGTCRPNVMSFSPPNMVYGLNYDGRASRRGKGGFDSRWMGLRWLAFFAFRSFGSPWLKS